MRRLVIGVALVVVPFVAVARGGEAGAAGELRLPKLFGNGMVLQRGTPVPVWGGASPGEEITVTLGAHRARARADKQGRWTARLPAMKAGGPFELVVRGGAQVKFTDVLVGEVWLCSGQSNMAMKVSQAKTAREALAKTGFKQLRMFHVYSRVSGVPVRDFPHKYSFWRRCEPKMVAKFSAVGYFFARELHRELKVPVGIINASLGGTRIEPWTPRSGFSLEPKLAGITRIIAKADADAAKAPAGGKHPLAHRTAPTSLYNGTISPVVPFAFRGVIWYQGESNRGDPGDHMLYYHKMRALVGGWRKEWGRGDFPFYFVQIAPRHYSPEHFRAKGHAYGKLIEAQTASLAIANTGMVVTTDIGNVQNIHPRNKLDVGRRLSRWALARDYGRKDLVCSGPLYKSMKIEKGGIRLEFDYVGGGLASRDGKPLSWFQIAAADRKFVKARAVIDGKTVLVSSPEVPKPVAVRFGWSQDTDPNLMNKEGLPASPFRTDRW